MEAQGTAAFNLHFGVQDCGPAGIADCRWLDLQDLVVVGGRVDASPSPGVDARIAAIARLSPGVLAAEVDETEQAERIQPISLEVPEAWIGLDEVLVPALRLRVGQQRFAWGTGLGVNPIDVVNPYDLRDPTRFDQRLGVPAVSARVHHQQAAVEAVWLPLFRPARMPAEVDLLGDADTLFDFSDVGGADVQLGELETRTDMPDARFGFSGGAVRASVAAPLLDVAVVGFYGRDTLPQVGGSAVLIGFAADEDRVDVGIPVVYPRMGLVGAELRAPLWWDVGAWAEGAVVFPERVAVTASRGQLEGLVDLGVLDAVPDPLPRTVVQDGKPYGRWVAGIDRFFGPVSVNLQWVHGLPTERRAREVRDYAAVAVLWTVSDPVQVRASVVTDARGVLASGQIAALHRDAATLTLGFTWVSGPDASALGQLEGLANASAGVEVAF